MITGMHLRPLWVVLRMELRLFLHGRGIWAAALILFIVGLNLPPSVRNSPFSAWGRLASATIFPTLLLALVTGDQIVRDRGQRVDAVLLSTAVPTWAYAWGKYLAALLGLLATSTTFTIAAVLMDRLPRAHSTVPFLGTMEFPPLGAWPYIAGWIWLIVTPVIFGTALALAATTLGGRIPAAVLILVLWLLPATGTGAYWLVDVSTQQLTAQHHLNTLDQAAIAREAIHNLPADACSGPHSYIPVPTCFGLYSARDGHYISVPEQRLMAIIARHLPPPFPPAFYWNRALFLGLAPLLLCLSVWLAGRQRRGLR
jgi:hypothetical protein